MPTKLDQSSTASRKALALFSILLFSKQAYSLKQLAESLGCSRQTVLRLMEEMVQTNICRIKSWKEGGQNWYQAETPQTSPNVALTAEEVAQLLLCRDFMRHLLPEKHQRYLDSAAAKAVCLASASATQCSPGVQSGQGSVKGGIDYSSFEKAIEILAQARPKLQVVELEYLARQRLEPKMHAFVPMRFVSYHDGLYVRGWRVNDKGNVEILSSMLLAIQRIRNIWPTRRVLSNKISDATPFPAESDHFGIAAQTEPFLARVCFYPPGTVYVRERQWSKYQQIEDLDDGSFILTFSARSELELVKWVLSFGQEAELLSPEHLRQQVAQELAVATQRYA